MLYFVPTNVALIFVVRLQVYWAQATAKNETNYLSDSLIYNKVTVLYGNSQESLGLLCLMSVIVSTLLLYLFRIISAFIDIRTFTYACLVCWVCWLISFLNYCSVPTVFTIFMYILGNMFITQ